MKIRDVDLDHVLAAAKVISDDHEGKLVGSYSTPFMQVEFSLSRREVEAPGYWRIYAEVSVTAGRAGMDFCSEQNRFGEPTNYGVKRLSFGGDPKAFLRDMTELRLSGRLDL